MFEEVSWSNKQKMCLSPIEPQYVFPSCLCLALFYPVLPGVVDVPAGDNGNDDADDDYPIYDTNGMTGRSTTTTPTPPRYTCTVRKMF